MPKVTLIVGPPGTGKTTFMQHKTNEHVDLWCKQTGGLPHECRDVLVATLTKGAASEAKSRGIEIAEGQIATLHSHCYRALGRPKLLVDGKDVEEFNKWLMGKNRKSCCISPYGEDRTEGGKNKSRGDWKLERYLLNRSLMQDPEEDEDEECVEFARLYNQFKRLESYADFADCILHVLEDGLPPPNQPSLLIVDEAQDNDALETSLIRMWSEHVDHTMIIGDPDQNLYEWRGSNSANLTQAKFDNRRILSKSYRVPARVLDFAMEIRERIGDKFDIRYQPRPHVGEVLRPKLRFNGRNPFLEPGKDQNTHKLVEAAEPYLDDGRTVMFIAAAGSSLRDVVRQLRERGHTYHNPFVPANPLWNPYRTRKGCRSVLGRMADFLRPNPDAYGEDARLWTWHELWSFVEWLKATDRANSMRLLAHGAKVKVKTESHGPRKNSLVALDDLRSIFEDQAQFEELADDISPEWFHRWATVRHQARLMQAEAVYNRGGVAALTREPRAIVGTIHSVKGGQADVVFLCPDLGTAFYETLQDEQKCDQIHRMFYVAATRARETLVLCEPSDRYKMSGGYYGFESVGEAGAEADRNGGA